MQFKSILTILSMVTFATSGFAQVTLTPVDEKFASKDIHDLVIHVVDADVTVNTSNGSSVSVQIIVKGNDLDKAMEYYEKQNFSVHMEDSALRIRSEREKSYGTSYDWRNSADIHVAITMPSDIPSRIQTSDGDLEIDELIAGAMIKTSDGDISIGTVSGSEIVIQTSDGDIDAELLASPSISVETSDGDVVLGNISGDLMKIRTSDGDILIDSATGNLNAQTSDGDLMIGEMISPAASVRTSDGEIEIEKVSGSLALRAGDGDVKLGLIDPNSINVTLSDGDALLSIPQDLSATLDIKGEDVKMDSFPNFSGNFDDSMIDGDLNGGGALIRVRTSDGNIVMRSMEY